jgi:DNA-binding NarL/FixJ family response regulator
MADQSPIVCVEGDREGMGYNILIVDDSKLARMSVARALTTLRPDWTRIEAANAVEALALVRSTEIDITLLDFNMPGQDGLSLAAELLELKPNMPVAVISANHQAEIVAKSHEIGAAFIAKPLTERVLADFLDASSQRLAAAGK